MSSAAQEAEVIIRVLGWIVWGLLYVTVAAMACYWIGRIARWWRLRREFPRVNG